MSGAVHKLTGAVVAAALGGLLPALAFAHGAPAQHSGLATRPSTTVPSVTARITASATAPPTTLPSAVPRSRVAPVSRLALASRSAPTPRPPASRLAPASHSAPTPRPPASRSAPASRPPDLPSVPDPAERARGARVPDAKTVPLRDVPATVSAVTAPSVTVPSVTIPSVTVPSVTTPVVSTPSVTTPAVRTPSVGVTSTGGGSGSGSGTDSTGSTGGARTTASTPTSTATAAPAASSGTKPATQTGAGAAPSGAQSSSGAQTSAGTRGSSGSQRSGKAHDSGTHKGDGASSHRTRHAAGHVASAGVHGQRSAGGSSLLSDTRGLVKPAGKSSSGHDHSRQAARRGHARPASVRASPITTTITRIVGVVPTFVWSLIGALAALALALAIRTRLAGVRARRLERQRSELLADVGLLQAALLPTPRERLGPVGVSVAYRPADGPGAGGDFYDVFALGDGRIAVIVGDISGHGRPALPHTALVRYTLRAYLEAGLSPREAVQTAGAVLDRQLAGSFATVVAATYHPRARTLTYACAGHPPPLVLGAARAGAGQAPLPGDLESAQHGSARRGSAQRDGSAQHDGSEQHDGSAQRPQRPIPLGARPLHRGARAARGVGSSRPLVAVTAGSAPPLGAGMRTGTRQSVVSLPGRALICFHTDGVTEARVGAGAKRELFGAERLACALAELGPAVSASELLDRVAGQTSARPDDMAACLLSVEGGEASPATLSEEAELDASEALSERTERFLLACGAEPAETAGLMRSAAALAARSGGVLVAVQAPADPGGRPRVELRPDNVAPLRAPGASGAAGAASAAGVSAVAGA